MNPDSNPPEDYYDYAPGLGGPGRVPAGELSPALGGSSRVPYLLAALEDDDPATRRRAITLLGHIRDERSVHPILATLRNESEASDVRLAAISALGNLGHWLPDRHRQADIVDLLVAFLLGWRTGYSKPAGVALRRIGSPAVPALLDNFYRSNYDQERALIVHTLGLIGDPRGVPALLDALHAHDQSLRIRAVFALQNIGARLVESPYRDRVLDALLSALNDQLLRLRWRAALALKVVGDKRVVPALIAVLDDSFDNVRDAAANALGGIGDRAALQPLINVLKQDAHERVRERAATALAGLGTADAIPPLLAVLDPAVEPDGGVRSGAAWALGSLVVQLNQSAPRTQVIPALLSALHDEDSRVRLRATRALEILSPQVQDTVLRSELADGLLAALNDPYADVRGSAIDALGTLLAGAPRHQVSRRILTALAQHLDDTSIYLQPIDAAPQHRPSDRLIRVSNNATEALQRIATPQARAVLAAYRRARNRQTPSQIDELP